MLEGLNILLCLPLLLLEAESINPDKMIIVVFCILEFLIIALLVFERFFPAESKKGSSESIKKLKEENKQLKAKIEDAKKEKKDAVDIKNKYNYLYEKNAELEKTLEFKDNKIKKLQKELDDVKKGNSQLEKEILSNPINPSSSSEIQQPIGINGQRDGSSSINIEIIGNNVVEQDDTGEQSTKDVAVVRKKLYASSYSREKKTFYEISPVPTENTIYVMSFLTESDTEAELSIFPGATEMIIACRDFLEICCDTIGYGKEMKVEKPGLVVQENGLWKVKDDNKVIVKFF